MSTFDTLVAELTRDAERVQPRDALQFCANWFQQRLEEQRARTRDILNQRSSFTGALPTELYKDSPIGHGPPPKAGPTYSPYTSSPQPHLRTSLASSLGARDSVSMRGSVSQSPFGTLNVPGNALLSDDQPGPPIFQIDGRDLPPTSPLTTSSHNPFGYESSTAPAPMNPGDYLHPPTSAIFARRTSVSAESILVDSGVDEPLPVFPKTDDQLRRIKAAIGDNFIFRDLDEEQETGVLNAMREVRVQPNEVVIRQGDVGDYFYVVESGLLHCYIHSEPLPPSWAAENHAEGSYKAPARGIPPDEKFVQPGQHPEYGTMVAECKPANSFGELALMYGHPRAATVLAIESSLLWAVDRITFRTIILKAAHRRRTMYEQFLSTVTLLSSLDAAERSKIADALQSRVYEDGEAVVRQGEMGDTFFFVEDGEAVVTKTLTEDTSETKEITAGYLRKGDYFGELSLLRLAPRAATVSAVQRKTPSLPKLKVAALDAPAFTRLLGPLRDLMERKAGENYSSRALNR
ncbi:hypothetical protein HGRIS_009705 [Hohenbuehelia grisea]|uniref:cAMP-dependent protein kinase regulatory subunit n=1 Tax=Hohenbuehelia grisea TaxID=104357 RepID=A0ABR3J2D3_9AGAR